MAIAWPNWTHSLAVRCLVGVGLGLVAGEVAEWTGGAWTGLSAALDAMVRVWTNAFRLLVIPLTAALLFRVVLENQAARDLGRIGLASLAVFVGLMLLGFLSVPLTVLPLLRLSWFDRLSAPSPSGLISEPPLVSEPSGWTEWVDGLMPTNAIAAAAADNVLGVMVVAVLVGLAIRHTTGDWRPFANAARIVVEAAFVFTGWLVWISPVMLFALGFKLAAAPGARIGEFLVGYLVVEVVALVLFGAVLFGVAAVGGQFSPARLARATAPGIVTAVTTRSSLATIPVLLQSSERELGLRPAVSAYVLPLAGATLKVSRAISAPARLFFLAAVLDVPIGPAAYLGFCLTIMVLSLSTAGIPRAVSGHRSVPAYVAVGVPAEYVVLVGSLTWVTDAILSAINAMTYLTANVLVGRVLGQRVYSAAAPTAVAAAPAAGPES